MRQPSTVQVLSRDEFKSMLSGAPKRSKYGSKRTKVNGISFHSAKEASRYSQLLLLQRAGEIKGLELQPRYKLVVDGVLVTTYIADFRYKLKCGRLVIEDVKGFRTDEYKIKKNLFEALHRGLKILET